MSSATLADQTPVNGRAMTIGQLSRRTGVPVKALRRHEGMGLIGAVALWNRRTC